ncbi:zinc finger domain-containing protein [Streptomyces resistomycificus]|uniref:zinc finger domain-containing protein n=1 Tax=Streptomyces resistomycificus TaxID=67356 RepID=UPI00068BDB95|nr:hypothetical protein [Streptomyces resistomycificus]KUN99527.1 hypothetical protein AQJ84_11305 [Streptomyces resistomycificus]
MNPTEAAELLGHAAAFDNRNPSAAAAVAWAAALEDVPLDADAKAAVALYYRTPPQNPNERLWILPHHIRTLRTKIRSARLENFQYEPIADETVPEYLARLRGQTQAIASGRIPAPTGRLALEGAPSRELMGELEARGWEGNRTVDDEDTVEAELIDSVRRSGPLGVVCPVEKCRAAIGKPCKAPGGTDRQPLGKPRLKPHSARLRAANGIPEAAEAERAAEEQRIRQMSAAHLAREADDIPDAVIVDEEAVS